MNEELKKGIPKAVVIGEVSFTEEEKKQNRLEFEKILRENGVLEGMTESEIEKLFSGQ